MEHFRLIVFEAVWSLGSYTKAARQLGITQPAVSQNIAELEKELGTELFVRGTAGTSMKGGNMTPTPAADVFIKLARRALKDYEDIRTLFNPEVGSDGTVRILADRSASEYVLPKVLNVLKATHPLIDFEVLPIMETPINNGAAAQETPATDGTEENPVSQDNTTPTDITITTVPISQGGTTALRFEALGPSTPLLPAGRLLLSESSLFE
ncbi:MAG: LysR family transcriptional regulator [Bacteroidales bacterium]|nr:LysR family transcriptional regulator [Bacteroidales bacterium]